MTQPLRPYQSDAIEGLRRSLRAGNHRPLLQLATGSGKTRIAAEVVRSATRNRKKCLFLAPRRELIIQARDALAKQGVLSGIIMAGERPSRIFDVQVASFDTLHARAIRADRMDLPAADVVIVDEAHLSIAETRKEIIGRYGEAIVIGLTATPARADGRGLGEIYDDIVVGPSIQHLTDEGFLVPLRYYGPSDPDLSAIKLNRDGDYQERGLSSAMDTPQLVGDIVENWIRLASSRLTVVFCVNRAHSRHVCEHFQRIGVKAEHLDGETPTAERKAILSRVAAGETQVLCNVFVATYGLDIPALDCAVLARPTKNIALYLQMIGRIMRPAKSKPDALVIDHSGAVKENGFVDEFIPWSLDSGTKIRDRKEAAQRETKEPKVVSCPRCHAEFKGRRDCPACGFESIQKGEGVPVHEAELEEMRRTKSKDNREATWEEKIGFIGGLRRYALEHGYQSGWVDHKYKERFGVWPNDARVKGAPPMEYGPTLRSWIQHQQIRYAKRRKAA